LAVLRAMTLAVALLLLLLPAQASTGGSSVAPPAQNWTGVDNNYPLNWSYNPQQNITQANVASLQVQWTYPVPAAPPGDTGAEGVMVTPLVVSGIMYAVTNWSGVFAINAANGQSVWFTQLPLVQNYTSYLQPSVPPSTGVPIGHYHQMYYTTHILGVPLVWVVSNTYQVFALNALSGDVVLDFNPLLKGSTTVSGNFGIYDQDTPTMMLDDKRGILVFGPSDSEGQSAGRGFVQGWNVNTTNPSLLWTTYIIPPQDGSNPEWSLNSVENMSHAYIFNGTAAIDLKSLPTSTLDAMLGGDWGNFAFDGLRSYAGASAGWGGSWALDEPTGTVYLGTSTATPDWNATYRPGPDLWSDSVLALDIVSGALVWGFQEMAHPLGDLDCSWNVVLANETIGGVNQPVVFKGCKDGYVFALNAHTGSMMWYLRPPSVKYIGVEMLNPLNATQMTRVNWYGDPKAGKVVQNPGDTGSIESDLAFDPTTNSLFVATYNDAKVFQLTDVGPPPQGGFDPSAWEFNWGADLFTIAQTGPINTTILSVNAATGSVNWSYLIKDLPYRGGLTVSGGLVYASTLDGVMRFLSESSGRLVGQRNVGGSLLTQPAIAADISGRMMVYITDMGSSRWGPVFPGFLQAFAVAAPTGEPSGVGVWSVPLAAATAFAAAAGLGAAVLWRRKTRVNAGHSQGSAPASPRGDSYSRFLTASGSAHESNYIVDYVDQ
jgi:alcohol dehydrogenase (cytochrome c)